MKTIRCQISLRLLITSVKSTEDITLWKSSLNSSINLLKQSYIILSEDSTVSYAPDFSSTIQSMKIKLLHNLSTERNSTHEKEKGIVEFLNSKHLGNIGRMYI